MVAHLQDQEGLRLVRNLCALTPKLHKLLYGQIGNEEIAFQLVKADVDHFIPDGNIDELIATLHDLKERATFRMDLRDFGVDLSQSTDFWVRKFFEVILREHRYLHLTTVQEICNPLGITLAHLDRSFKKDGCRMTPKQILICLKNYYAAYLIDTTNWPGKKIVQRCGFTNEHEFYKSLPREPA